MLIRTLTRIDGEAGVKIAANAVIDLPKAIAEKLIAEGKAERVKDADTR